MLCADGMWHDEFAQHQPSIVQDSPNCGSGCDGSNMTGHEPLPAPGLLPAVQRALFVRLTQKYQEDEEPSSTQPQRAPSKEEGISDVSFYNAANNIVIQASESMFWIIPRSGLAGSFDNSMFNVLRNHQVFPQYLRRFIFPPAAQEVLVSLSSPTLVIFSFLLLF